jgi:hypothetical protein
MLSAFKVRLSFDLIFCKAMAFILVAYMVSPPKEDSEPDGRIRVKVRTKP